MSNLKKTKPDIENSNPEVKSNSIFEIMLYPDKDDIYRRAVQQPDIDPEQLTKRKSSNDKGKNNEKSFLDDISGDDLDVPGSELDDAEETIGSEDEENNYYSSADNWLKTPEIDNGE